MAAMRSMSVAILVITFVLASRQISSCKAKALKLSVTKVEQRDEGKPSRVDAQTVEQGPTLYYKLSCGIGAENIEVGHIYKAAENKTDLVISDVKTANGGIFGLACDIESVAK